MAAITAIVGAVVALGTTAYSFVEAEEQKKAQAAAEHDAKQYMADARRRLDVNYYKSLSIDKEPYAEERKALAAAGAQAIQAAQEGETRGIGATADRIQMAQVEGQAGIRTAQAKEQNYLDLLVANEESRLRDINVQLDLEETAGAQIAAAQAWEARQDSIVQGMKGIQNTMESISEFVPLYQKEAAGRKAKRIERNFNKSKTAAEGGNLYDSITSIDPSILDAETGGAYGLVGWLSEQKPDYVQTLYEQMRTKGIFEK